jgi:hypothetical protein
MEMKPSLARIASTCVVAACLAAAPVAAAHPLPKEPARPAAAVASDVEYYGGPVLSHVKVIAVLWGKDVDSSVASGIGPFYAAAVDSTYLDWLDLYNTKRQASGGRNGTQQDIGRGTYGGLVTIAPASSGHLDQGQIESELDRQIDAGTLPSPDANTLYMIHFPSSANIDISFGASCDSWCADHEGYNSPKHGYIYYAMMPECLAGCGGGSAFESITEAASHELVEAVTDPACPLANQGSAYPAAWIRGDGQEVGDLCAWVGTTLKTASEPYTVQSIWSNATGSCNDGPFTSP